MSSETGAELDAESGVVSDKGPGKSKKILLFLGVALAVVGLAAAVVLVALPGVTPGQVAEKWVADNVDMAGERVAGVIVDGMGREESSASALKELGGEWIADRVDENLLWTFSPAVEAPENHVVVATGSVSFGVAEGLLTGVIEASVPFELLISGNSLVGERLVMDGVSLRTDFEGAGADLSGEEVVEKSPEKSPDKSPEESPDKSPDKSPEESPDKSPEESPDKSADAGGDEAGDLSKR